MKQSAEQGDKDAQYTLGRSYETGRGLAQSDENALYWYRKAAENDSALAMDRLAKAYQQGLFGLEKSPVKWDYWQKRAAETRARTHEVDPSSWTLFDWIKYKFSN